MTTPENPEISEKQEFKRPKYTTGDRIYSSFMRTAFTIMSIKALGLKDGLELVNSRESITGMLEGAIVGQALAYPDQEDGHLVYEKADAGQWLGYDPNRSLEFAKEARARQVRYLSRGVLWRLLPDDIKDNDADTKTPTWFTDPFYINHLKTMNHPLVSDLVLEGLFRATTMAEAYDRLDMGDYIPDLEARSLAKDTVYQVTPKGNTLVTVLEEAGDTKPKYEPHFRTVPVPDLLAT